MARTISSSINKILKEDKKYVSVGIEVLLLNSVSVLHASAYACILYSARRASPSNITHIIPTVSSSVTKKQPHKSGTVKWGIGKGIYRRKSGAPPTTPLEQIWNEAPKRAKRISRTEGDGPVIQSG